MKYTPKYKIKSVKFTHKGKQYDVKSSDILSGVYEYEKGGKLKNYTYIRKNDIKGFETNDGSIEKHSNGIWVLSKVLKETPKKAIKKTTPKKAIKKTTTNKKVVSKTKIRTMLSPSEKFKGKKNMPVKAFEIAEKMVEMKKAKAKKSEIMKIQNDLFKILQQEKNSEFLYEPLAYTVLWLNFNMPITYGFTPLTETEYLGSGLVEAYKKEFKNAPDVSKKVIKIKTGNFTSNIIEQKLSKDFTGNDDLRPNLNYTYIDDGYAVSTDAHKLLGIYDKSLLGKEEFFGDKDELWKLGKYAKYPKWRQVLPSPYQLKTKKINAQLLYNFLLKLIKYKATSGYSYGMVLKIDNETTLGFNTRLLIESLATSMKFGDDVYIHYLEGVKARPVLFTNIKDWDLGKPNSTFVLTMPIMVDDIFDYILYDLNTESYEKGGEVKQTISKPFKSNDRTFDKVYNAFDKKDYFNSKGFAKNQIGNFERAVQKNDKGAKQVLDLFKGDEKKAKDYITQVISDRNKELSFNNYKALKSAVDSIQKGKPDVGAVDYVKRIIHNSSQKYSIALYSAIRNKKFTKWKDVHDDIDSLIGESVNETNNKPKFKVGGEVKQTIDALKKGDELTIKFGSSVSKDNSVNLKVRSRNKVRKGTIDKITFENIKNPKGVKFYAYERGSGRWFFAMGDMAISNIEIVSYKSMAKGGKVGGEKWNDIYDKYPAKKYYMSRTQSQDWGKIVLEIKEKTGEKTSSGRDIYKDEPVAVFVQGADSLWYKQMAKGGTLESKFEGYDSMYNYALAKNFTPRQLAEELRFMTNLQNKGDKELYYFLNNLSNMFPDTPVSEFKKGGMMQGYNDRLNESLGNTKGKRSKKEQNYKDRRNESEAMEKKEGKRKYSRVKTMDKGSRKLKKPNSFFAVVKREQKEGESWKDAIQRVKKEKSKKK